MSNKYPEIVSLDFAVMQTCIGSFGKASSGRNSLGLGFGFGSKGEGEGDKGGLGNKFVLNFLDGGVGRPEVKNF